MFPSTAALPMTSPMRDALCRDREPEHRNCRANMTDPPVMFIMERVRAYSRSERRWIVSAIHSRNLPHTSRLREKGGCMPRFYINFRTAGRIVLDDVGQDLPGLEEAKATAIASAREILANNIRTHNDAVLDSVIIANEQGEELAKIAAKDVSPDAIKN